ncbi:Hypothetical predicted protein [Cloeon dipterum]|uniref:Caspase family p20 domain-containing protein n=1 Tax=Cloeon dipterum TaxID=197152 RepID=A0A8S1C693_9INSE|nr:Hypothetical predicted protein [Cloeon dipterum]
MTDNAKYMYFSQFNSGYKKSFRKLSVLVVHYGFAGVKELDRLKDNQEDVNSLRDTLSKHCREGNYKETSGRRDEVLGILENIAQDKETPDLLVVCIMTHGKCNGRLLTHHPHHEADIQQGNTSATKQKFEEIRLSEIYEKLKAENLENTVKLVLVQACRGLIAEENCFEKEPNVQFVNENIKFSKTLGKKDSILNNTNATRVTTELNCKNFVVMLSGVEGTVSFRKDGKPESGSWLIQTFCSCLNSLGRNMELEEFLAWVSFTMKTEFIKKENYGSSPEIKLFPHKKLTFSRSDCANLSSPPESFFYDWRSKSDKKITTRKAHFFAADGKEDCVALLMKAMKERFNFLCLPHETVADLESAVKNGDELDGCILICVLGNLTTETIEGKNEICMTMKGSSMPLKHIISKTIFPKTEDWIGKPKLAVFLNNENLKEVTKASAEYPRCETPFTSNEGSRSGTIHEGLLSLILPQRDAVQLFLNTLTKFAASNNTSSTVQELFVAMLQYAKPYNHISPVIISTLRERLKINFPSTIPNNFFKKIWAGLKEEIVIQELVELFSSIFCCQKSAKKQSTNDCPSEPNEKRQKLETISRDPKMATVWLMSSPASTGKSYLANYLASTRVQSNGDVITIDLRRAYQFLDKFGWQNQNYETLINEYLKHVGQNKSLGDNDIVILDSFEAVKENLQEHFFKMIQDMAENEVFLLITARSELQEKFQNAITGLTVIQIGDLTESEQVEFLLQQLKPGESESDIQFALTEIRKAYGEEFTGKVGTLEKLAKFPKFARVKPINIDAISKYLVESTVESGLVNNGVIRGYNLFDKCFHTIMSDLEKCANAYITGSKVTDIKSDIAELNRLDIMVVNKENRVEPVNEKIALYLAKQGSK